MTFICMLKSEYIFEATYCHAKNLAVTYAQIIMVFGYSEGLHIVIEARVVVQKALFEKAKRQHR
jgi:hypothetical protein